MNTLLPLRTPAALALLFCAGLLLPDRAPAMAGKLDHPSLSFPSGFQGSEDIMKVLSDKKFRFAGGSFINAVSTLRYEGDAASLNDFLARLATCKGVKLSVGFNDGKTDLVTGGDAPEAAAAWTLGHNAWGDANAIHITVDTRRIPEKEVKVPK